MQIPEELKRHKNFVAWKYEERNGKRTKVPYNAVTRGRAKSNVPATWNTWQEVENCPQGFDGIGFMFGNSPYVGIDIDHCLDGGREEETALAMAKELGTYCEVSPSGEGLHMIGRGDLANGFRKGKLEVYPYGRYFTLTGNVWHGLSEIVDIQAGLDVLAQMAKKPAVPVKQRKVSPPPDGVQEILARIRRSAQAGKFFDLYDRGDISAYGGDDSAADMALMNMLPFWTGGDAGLMLEIFSGSKLAQRDKWQRRADYRQWTVSKALQGWNGQTYSQEYGKHEVKQGTAGLLDFAHTDTGNAERLFHIHGKDFMYIVENGHWLAWNGKNWEEGQDRDGVQLYDKVTEVFRKAYMEAMTEYNKTPAVDTTEEKQRAATLKFFRQSENLPSVRNCINRARSLFMVNKEQLDSDPYTLNCGNGTVNLKTGELKPHDRKDYITKICRADYVPGAKSELWEETLHTILPDEEVRAWLKRFMGYSLYGLTSEEKFLFLYGPGGGGKGTLVESIAWVLGDYAGTMDIDTILSARNDAGDGGQATPQIAGLAGKRLIITSESGAGRKFNSARIKLITGGDRLTARYLHGNPFTFQPQFSLVMSSNYKPALSDSTDEGMRRRLIIVPFTTKIEKKDVLLKENLRKEAGAAILAWCVEGAMDWWKDGGLGDMPVAIRKIMGDYYEENDVIGQFIRECCEVGQDAKVKVRDFHRAFCEWLEDERGMTLRTFSDQMEAKGFEKHRYNRGMFFTGVKLLEVPV